MASRPPDDRLRATPPTERERARFFALNAVRLSGVVLVGIGLLALNRALDLPQALGWVLVAVGLIEVFVVPQVLARRWRTRSE